MGLWLGILSMICYAKLQDINRLPRKPEAGGHGENHSAFGAKKHSVFSGFSASVVTFYS